MRFPIKCTNIPNVTVANIIYHTHMSKIVQFQCSLLYLLVINPIEVSKVDNICMCFSSPVLVCSSISDTVSNLQWQPKLRKYIHH